jgi:polyferredoxin
VVIGQKLEEMGMDVGILAGSCLHAICPFGGVVSIYQFIATGTFVQKIDQSAFVLMYIVFALALIAGPVFCGWVCPFGSFQEWLSSAGRKFFGKRFNNIIPTRIEKYLGLIRYTVLVLVVYATAVSATLVFADYDPYHALFRFWSGDVAVSAIIVLGIVIALSLVVDRPFCKYGCPYGALLGIFNYFRIFKLRRNKKTCINCKQCDHNCPMNITVSTAQVVSDPRCITCLKCTSEFSCPVKDTLLLSSSKP